MSKYYEYYKIVDEIENNLRMDLIGATSEYEIIEGQEPLNFYNLGILFPQRKENSNNPQDELEDNNYQLNDIPLIDDTEEVDTISYTMKYKPSAMGISLVVPSSACNLDIIISFGKYQRKDVQKGYIYERFPIYVETTLHIPNSISYVKNNNNLLKDSNVGLYCYVRKIFKDNSKLITISLVNEMVCSNKLQLQNENSMFQCKLEIISEYDFMPISNINSTIHNAETLTNLMLYRDIKNYAIGHGCATKIINSKYISSDFLPSQEVVQLMPRTITKDSFLKMETYENNPDRNKLCMEMEMFILEYQTWLNGLKSNIEVISKFKDVAIQSINNISICIERLKLGVELLKNDDITWKCFELMNIAMLLQRINTKHCPKDVVYWYPFQMAYILQIIPDIVNENSKYRNTVDLLWFPTGGGKTEAYLGVSAFVIFNRRIRKSPIQDTTAIIMRYTLRLLTIQQFERANALICACEYLRKKYNICGGEISIGLWIGSSMTPNKIDSAKKVLSEIKENGNIKITSENPIQVNTCPWCGSTIDVGCYSFENNHMIVRCKYNNDCVFYNRLPIHIVDEDIYDASPTLILSTIDKFARITWEEKARNIFGKHIKDSIPPELIIQDELHLISGALGSITGAYEMLIDYLSEKNGTYPKIITSTATVRNAKKQIKNLYNRDMLQFPPNGFDYNDSFFAIQSNRDNRPIRRYLGLCETGGSMANLMIRVYSNLMFTRNLLIKKGVLKKIVDQYYTIVGYFNALRDLGSSSTIINDRIYTSIRTLITHKFKDISQQYGLTTKDIPIYEPYNELTSRKSSKEIKDTLENLIKSYETGEAYSYILSSNMLSVGIDIDRLGIMTVYNQPKTTSEYIQATSRAGRNNPGVILTLYNAMRSRDKSYYENFPYYHKTFYQQVEPTSVTPFSRVCIQKTLSGVFIGLVRQSIPKLNSNSSAGKFNPNDSEVKRIKEYILQRISCIDKSAVELANDYLDYICQQWEHYANLHSNSLKYIDYNENICLLQSAESEVKIDFPTVLNSLRNVDEECNIYLSRRYNND